MGYYSLLRFGLLQNGDVGVGVFPERKEIFVRGERTDAKFFHYLR